MIFEQIEQNDAQTVAKNILETYKQKKTCRVMYVYFANLAREGILSGKNTNQTYVKALKKSDFLLPDGIALRMYAKKKHGLSLFNLNGTDFIDTFLHSLPKKSYTLILYGAQKEVIEKINSSRDDVFYFQDGYCEFDWGKLENIPKWKIPIFLLGLGTPKQEIFIEKNRENIEKYRLLAFCQWGTFDFWSGRDSRAPKMIQQMKLEWFWRLCTNPKKNFKKVWRSLSLFWYLWK